MGAEEENEEEEEEDRQTDRERERERERKRGKDPCPEPEPRDLARQARERKPQVSMSASVAIENRHTTEEDLPILCHESICCCCASNAPLPEYIEPTDLPIYEADTFLTLFCSTESAVMVARFVFKHPCGATLFLGSILLSLILVMMGLFVTTLEGLVYVSLYFAPALFFTAMCMNRTVVYCVLKSFDFYLTLAVAVIAMTAFGDLMAWDARAVVGPPIVLLTVFALLMEALPASTRYFRLVVHVLLTGTWAFLLLLYFLGYLPDQRFTSYTPDALSTAISVTTSQVFMDSAALSMILSLRETTHALTADKNTFLRLVVPVRAQRQLWHP